MNEKYDIVGDIHGHADNFRGCCSDWATRSEMGSTDMLPDKLSSSATSLTQDQKFAARCRSHVR